MTKVCLRCNCILESNRQTRFCSRDCDRAYTLEQNVNAFLNGENKTKDPRSIRRYLFETREYKCEECDNTEWQGQPIPLQVDHIDGNWENNIPENVRLLCPNCHALTPTWGFRNKGNGRHYRRVRYAEGKSS